MLLMPAFAVWAQSGAQIKRNIEQLKHKLENIERLAVKYKADNVLVLVQKAKLELTGAANHYKQGNYRKAIELYRNARRDTNLAAKMLLFKPLSAARKDFDRLIQRAERAAQGSDKTEARHMLIRARTFQTKAVRAYNSSLYLQGQEFQRIAVYFANKAIELAGASSDGRRSGYDDQLENLRRLYTNITSSNINNPNITRLADKAFSYFSAAKRFHEQGNDEQALFRLHAAERMLYRALDLQQTSSEGRKEQVRLNIVSLKNYIDGVERTINESQQSSGLVLLRKARRFYRAARRDYDNGNLAAARNKISLAQRMATRALQSMSSEPEADIDLIRDKIREIKHLIQLQKQKPAAQNPPVNILHDKAEKLLNRAETALEKGRGRRAFWMVRLTFRIVNRAEFILKNSSAAAVDKDRLQEDLAQLRKAYQTLERKENLNARIKVQADFLKDLIADAEQFMNQGRLQNAAELVRLAQGHLNYLLKEALD